MQISLYPDGRPPGEPLIIGHTQSDALTNLAPYIITRFMIRVGGLQGEPVVRSLHFLKLLCLRNWLILSVTQDNCLYVQRIITMDKVVTG